MLFVLLLVFILGYVGGASTVMGYGIHQMRKTKKKKSELTEQLKKAATELDRKAITIKDRLTRASELTQEQLALRAAAEMPSKNALHSRYKNGLVSMIEELEQQKLDLLRTVLAEGFDPKVMVVSGNGQREEVLLSSYVEEAEYKLGVDRGEGGMPADHGRDPGELPNEPKRVGKFVLYKGGKDDGTTH